MSQNTDSRNGISQGGLVGRYVNTIRKSADNENIREFGFEVGNHFIYKADPVRGCLACSNDRYDMARIVEPEEVYAKTNEIIQKMSEA